MQFSDRDVEGANEWAVRFGFRTDAYRDAGYTAKPGWQRGRRL